MQGKRLYSVETDKFSSVDSPEKAYWLGFLMADGSVDRYSLRIELSERDLSHLTKMQSFLKSNHPISKTRKGCHRISINSTELVKSMKKWGIVPNKTDKAISTPEIESRLIPYFYRGFFDGDGWFTKRDHKKCQPSYELGFCSNHKTILSEIKEWIESQIGCSCGTITHKKNKQGSTYQYIIGGNKRYILATRLLFSDQILGLDRKLNFLKSSWQDLCTRVDGRSTSGKLQYQHLLLDHA